MAYQRYAFKNISGVLKDKDPSDTPDDKWTDVLNVRFYQGEAVPADGYAQVFSGNTETPTWATPRVESNVPYWYYGSATKLTRTEGSSHVDVSRLVGGAYTSDDWNGCVLNGVVVANNSADDLQVLEGGAANFKDSTSFPSTLKANVIRSFKNYLFALNLTDTGTSLPYAVRWSDAADPGLEPASWDITNQAVDAGQVTLADTPGEVIDGLALRDQFIIYKTDSVYSVQFTGGAFVFSFRKLFEGTGILCENAVTSFEGKHFVVGLDDIYVHNGVNFKTVAEGVIKEFFYNDLNESYTRNVKVVTYPKYNQVWVFYPNADSTAGECTKALVWNWDNGVWAIRDIPPTRYPVLGVVDPQEDKSWDGGPSTTWQGDAAVWDSDVYNPANNTLLLLSDIDSKFYRVSGVSNFDGVDFDWRLEKESADLGDSYHFKYINAVIPRLVGSGTVQISVGTKDTLGEGILWSPPVTFTVGDDFRAYFRKKGRYCSFKFEGTSASTIRLLGFEVEGTIEGEK